MAGVFPGPDIAALLERLTRTPRQYALGELKRTIPFVGGPFSATTPSILNSQRGASPRPTQNYGNIGNAFGSAVSDAVTQLGQMQPQDPLMALYQQLLSQLQQPVNMPTSVNTADLMSQVHKVIDPIYDQRSKTAQAQGTRNRQEVKDMYRALSNDYERLAPQQAAQAADAQKQVEQLYGQLRSNIQGDYSRVSNEQGELFKQLGIEAALPDVLQEQQAPVADALTGAAENQAQQAQRYMDIGQADQTYYREGSPNATMAGNEISTSMLAELQDYLNNLEAERTSGIQETYMNQYNQAQNMLMQQQQMAQGEAGRRQGMLWDMLQSQLQGRKQQALTPDTYMSQLSPDAQQELANAFTRLQRSPEAVYGKVEDKRNPVPGTFVDTTPQWFMAQADEMLRRGEIDEETHQELLMYLQLYYGKK